MTDGFRRAPDASAPVPRGRVLVVDDDPEILEMTALLLENAGFAVDLAGSGEEALYRAHEGFPEVILLDLNMPGLDGWEVLRILKEDDATSGIPVVVFSVNFELRDRLRAVQQGASEYITKPFDTDGLLRRVQRLCGSAALATRASERS